MEMKYEHNKVHDKTVGEIVRGGYTCNENEVECQSCPFDDLSWKECSHCNDEKRKRVIEYIAEEFISISKRCNIEKQNFIHWQEYYCGDKLLKDKYPVDEQTAKEIADAARVLLEGGDVVKCESEGWDGSGNKFSAFQESCKKWLGVEPQQININQDHPTTADAICRHMAGLVDKTQPYHPTIADAFYVYNADLQKCVTVSIEQDDCIVDITIHNELDIDTARVFCEKLSSFLRSFGGEK